MKLKPSKKKTVKKVPARKTRRAPAAPKKRPFRLEVGKTYESRDGSLLVEIYEEREDHRYPFYGRLLKGNATLCWWRPNGRFFEDSVDQFDLVREVKQVKKG